MRAVIYTRKSNDPKKTFRSVESQEAECRTDAERQGYELVRVFSDNDRSATRYARRDRPAYAAMKEFLRQGGADVLLVWEGARAQRDLKDFAQLRDVCAAAGVLYRYNGRTLDMNDGNDRFYAGLDALVAERQAEDNRQAVIRELRANAKAGKPHGSLLYGYSRRYDERGELVEQVIREDQAAIVRDAARRVARGEAPYAVAKMLNDRGVPAPRGGQWDLTAVRRMVTNPAYIARRVHRRQIVGDADWPAILDEKTWSRCVSRLGDPSRKHAHDTAVRWLLSRIVLCDVCGAVMRVQKAQRRDYATYVCSAKSCVSVRAAGLDRFVSLVVTGRLSMPDAAEALAPASDRDAAAVASSEAAELRERLAGFTTLAAAGKLTPATLAAIEAELLPQIEAADQRARDSVASPILAEIARPDAGRIWEGLPVTVRRDVVRLLIDVRVKPAGKGARYLDRELVDEDPELARLDPDRVTIEWKSS